MRTPPSFTEILCISEQGCSRPFLCRSEGGDLYWCKGVFAGLRSVRNEWVCANLARQVSLPVPDFLIAKVEYALFDLWRRFKGPDVPSLVTQSNPYVFASLRVPDVKDVMDRSDVRTMGSDLQAKIVAFDEFIRNLDRSEFNSNLLVTLGLERKLYMIDHNLAFDDKFDRRDFLREHILRESLPEVSEADKQGFRRKLQGAFTESFLERVWNEMPSEWVEDDGAEAHKEQMLNAAKEVGDVRE